MATLSTSCHSTHPSTIILHQHRHPLSANQGYYEHGLTHQILCDKKFYFAARKLQLWMNVNEFKVTIKVWPENTVLFSYMPHSSKSMHYFLPHFILDP